MSTKSLLLASVALSGLLVSACATGTGPGFEGEGEGGAGGESVGTGGFGGATSASSSASNSASSSASSTSASSTSASSSSSTSAGTGGQMCGAQEHMCSGACAGNTPQTGCFTSTTCTPCPTAQNGSAICNTSGLCDVSCNSGYTKNGTTCVCASACCTDADCAAGQTCAGGVCSGGSSSSSSTGGGTCDVVACIFNCTLIGLSCVDPFACTCG